MPYSTYIQVRCVYSKNKNKFKGSDQPYHSIFKKQRKKSENNLQGRNCFQICVTAKKNFLIFVTII